MEAIPRSWRQPSQRQLQGRTPPELSGTPSETANRRSRSFRRSPEHPMLYRSTRKAALTIRLRSKMRSLPVTSWSRRRTMFPCRPILRPLLRIFRKRTRREPPQRKPLIQRRTNTKTAVRHGQGRSAREWWETVSFPKTAWKGMPICSANTRSCLPRRMKTDRTRDSIPLNLPRLITRAQKAAICRRSLTAEAFRISARYRSMPRIRRVWMPEIP